MNENTMAKVWGLGKWLALLPLALACACGGNDDSAGAAGAGGTGGASPNTPRETAGSGDDAAGRGGEAGADDIGASSAGASGSSDELGAAGAGEPPGDQGGGGGGGAPGGAAGADSSEGGTPVVCECSTGQCCDGCHVRPNAFVVTEAQYSAVCVANKIQVTYRYQVCDGTHATTVIWGTGGHTGPAITCTFVAGSSVPYETGTVCNDVGGNGHAYCAEP